MRWTIPVLFVILTIGCAYHAPDQPTPVIVTPSPAAAAIRIVGSSRPDRGVDITATVLTASGGFVPSATVSLTTSAGTLSLTSGLTDGTGTFRSILTTGGNATVLAQSGSLVSTVTVLGTPDNTTTPTPPIPPIPPVTPTSPPLTVAVGISGSPTAGTPTTFGLSTQALSSATWNFGDGSAALTTTGTGSASHTYGASGTYPVSVNVVDTTGRTASSSTSLVVAAAPVSPGSNPTLGLAIALGCTVPATHGKVFCNVSAAYNGIALPSGDIIKVDWDWGDGALQATFPPVAPVNSRTYSGAGTYTIFVTVTANTVEGLIVKTTSKTITSP